MGAPANLAPPGGTDGRGARSALHHHAIGFRCQAIEQQRGIALCHAVERGHRRLEAFAVGAISAGDDRPRSRPAVLRGPSAARTRRSPPLIRALSVTSRIWRHHGRERGPAALADRAEARGFGEERVPARGLRDLRRRLILPPTGAPRMRKATTTNKHIPSRPECRQGRGGNSSKRKGFEPRTCAYGLCPR